MRYWSIPIIAVLASCATMPPAPSPEPPKPTPDSFTARSVGPGFLPDSQLSIHRLYPQHFEYLGAFRLPSGELYAFSEGPKAWYIYGDHSNGDDFPGSLYGTGHLHTAPAYEISIPVPKITKNFSELYQAREIQPPRDVVDPISSLMLKDMEVYRGRLHLTFGKHYQYSRIACFGRSGMNLSDPRTIGPWHVGTASQVNVLNTNAYLFRIPDEWSAAHVNSKPFACGRHREGQEASGPSIIAYGLPNEEAPPPAGADLPATPLLLYDKLACIAENAGDNCMIDHCPADDWRGGAWIQAGRRAAVAIVGVKAQGWCWYGWRDPDGRRVVKGGDLLSDCETAPDDGIPCFECGANCESLGYGGDSRGYCADYFRTVILLYDPNHLALVAEGKRSAWWPQPYARVDITEHMIQAGRRTKIKVSGVAFDSGDAFEPDRRILYITEEAALETTSSRYCAIHAFRITP